MHMDETTTTITPPVAVPPAFRSRRRPLRGIVDQSRRGLATVAVIALLGGVAGGGIAGAALSNSGSGGPPRLGHRHRGVLVGRDQAGRRRAPQGTGQVAAGK